MGNALNLNGGTKWGSRHNMDYTTIQAKKSQAAKSLLKICKDVFVKFEISFIDLKKLITNVAS